MELEKLINAIKSLRMKTKPTWDKLILPKCFGTENVYYSDIEIEKLLFQFDDQNI